MPRNCRAPPPASMIPRSTMSAARARRVALQGAASPALHDHVERSAIASRKCRPRGYWSCGRPESRVAGRARPSSRCPWAVVGEGRADPESLISSAVRSPTTGLCTFFGYDADGVTEISSPATRTDFAEPPCRRGSTRPLSVVPRRCHNESKVPTVRSPAGGAECAAAPVRAINAPPCPGQKPASRTARRSNAGDAAGDCRSPAGRHECREPLVALCG